MDFDKLSQKLNSVLNLNTSNIIQWNSKGEAGQVINYLGKSYTITHSFLSNTKLLLTNSGQAIPEQVASDSSRILSERILFERRTNFQQRTTRRLVLSASVFGVDYYYEYGLGANALLVAIELYGLGEITEYSASVSTGSFAAAGIIFVDPERQISTVAWGDPLGESGSVDFLRHNNGVESIDVWPISPDPAAEYRVNPYNIRFCNSLIWMPGGISKTITTPTAGFPAGEEPTEIWGGFVYDCRNGNVSYALENKTTSVTVTEVAIPGSSPFFERETVETFNSKLLPEEPSVHASTFMYSTNVLGTGVDSNGDTVVSTSRTLQYTNCAQMFLADSAKRRVITTEQNGSITSNLVRTSGTDNFVQTNTHSSSPYYSSNFYDFNLGTSPQGPVRHTQHNAFPIDSSMRVESGVNKIVVGQTITYSYIAANRISLLPVNADSLSANRIIPEEDSPPFIVGGVEIAQLTPIISATINSMEKTEVEGFLEDLPYPCYGVIPTNIELFEAPGARAWAHIKGNITAVEYEILAGGVSTGGVFTGTMGLAGVYRYWIKSFTIQITEVFGYSPIEETISPSNWFTRKSGIWNSATGIGVGQEGWIFPDTGSICQMVKVPNGGPRNPYYSFSNYYFRNMQGSSVGEWGYQNSYTWLDGKDGKSYVAFRHNEGGFSPMYHREDTSAYNAVGLDTLPPFNKIKAKDRKNHSKIILAIWEFVYNETDSIYEFKFSHYKDYDIFNNSSVGSYGTYVNMIDTVNHFTVNDLTP